MLDDEASQRARPNEGVLAMIARNDVGGEALLVWESAAEFEQLRSGHHAEHTPAGPTERALVDRLVWTNGDAGA